MKRFQAKRDAAALNSRLVRRPIQRMVWLFLLPTFAAFCIGFIYPFLKGAFLSFCKFKLTSKWTWVGFDNYLKAFADSSFRHAFLTNDSQTSLEANQVTAITDYSPYYEGYYTVMIAAQQFFNGIDLQNIEIPFGVVTLENLDGYSAEYKQICVDNGVEYWNK